MKVLHLLASNIFSGAENVVCQIIKMCDGDVEMAYCSPNGKIADSLKEKNITFYPLESLNKKNVKEVLNNFKPDVIHAHDVKASIIASSFAKKYKIISHIHGNDERKMGKITAKSLLYNFASKKFSKIFWVSNSCFDKYYFKNKVKQKSEILSNIININNLQELCEKDKTKYNYDICYLGRLTEIKNPVRALEILKEVANKNNAIKCAIIGNGDLKQQCEDFVKQNNLQNNIAFLGFQSNPYKILKDSKVLLMSSINEGTPMVLLEAFSLGVPLVSTKIDGALELIKNDKMGALYETNEQAVKEIQKILGNSKNYYEEYLIEFSKKYNDIEKYKTSLFNAYGG